MTQENILENNLFKLWIMGEIKPDPPSFLRLIDEHTGLKYTLLRPGELTIITGATNQGKSKIASFFIRQILKDIPDNMFQRSKVKNINRILLFDTEMSDQRIHDWYIRPVVYDFTKTYIDIIVNDNRYIIKGIRNLSQSERVKLINSHIKEFKEKYMQDNLFIVIDNISGLIEDINSSSNNKIINELYASCSNCTTIILAHNNQKSDNDKNVSGSAGTSLINLASTRLNVSSSQIENGHQMRVQILKSKSGTEEEKKSIFFECKKEKEDFYLIKNIIFNDSIETDKPKSIDKVYELISEKLSKKDITDQDRYRKTIISELVGETDLKDKTIYNHIKQLLNEKKLFCINNNLFLKEDECEDYF